MKHLLATILLSLLAVGCSSEAATKTEEGSEQQQKSGTEALAEGHYHVKCGCSIEGIGRCGNYIMIDGKYVPMVHSDLGPMQWCGEKDAGAEVEAVGEVKDGKFVAESWKTVQE